MNTNKDNEFMFANENNLLLIVSIAKIVSWVVLAFYLISFVNSDIIPLVQGQTNFPTQIFQWPIAIANLFFAPAIGLFYFLVLQGVAHGLNLGLDIYYQSQPEEEDEVAANEAEA